MGHIIGISRQERQNLCWDDLIAPDNPVRVIDVFVDALDLEPLGFLHVRTFGYGRPPYHPKVLLKIYLYGYFNRIRSSRKLEVECHRNIEMRWLTENQMPCYVTIANFRTVKPHRKALREVFRLFNRILIGAELFGEENKALDGTKIRAQNSKKNNISEEKLNKRIEYHQGKFEEYTAALDQADRLEREGKTPDLNPDVLLDAMQEAHLRIIRLEELKALLEAAQRTDPNCHQISLVDPDARSMATNNLGHTEVCYNLQTVVDDKNHLIVEYEVENRPDYDLLSEMSIRAKDILDLDTMPILADKGYHDSEQLHLCAENGIVTYVAFPDQSYKDRPVGFRKDDFDYDADQDVYVCPAGEQLTTNGTVYDKRGRNGNIQSRFRRYSLPWPVCANCRYVDACLSDQNVQVRHGRHIERNIYEPARIDNRRRVINGRSTYKRRQAIVEHPFGTIKRSWGFYYTLLKGREKVNTEYAIVCLTYNLRRAINILGAEGLIKRIKQQKPLCLHYCKPLCAILLKVPEFFGRKIALACGAMTTSGGKIRA
jgi:transposase